MENKNSEKQNKTFPYTITVIGYVLILLFLLITAPVVCPPIIGQHTYTVSEDHTGLISPKGTLVYAKDKDKEALVEGNIVAVDNEDGDRDVDYYYVDDNNTADQTIALRDGETVSYDLVKGIVRKKTPVFGYLSGVLFHVWGIILDIVILVAGVGITTYANKIRKEQKEAEKRAKA